jgi:predicted glycoside hydrolase/deacetylase ChbG (UPF0249 family)
MSHVRRAGTLVNEKRHLVVTADDYGIGPRTSAGILELGRRGILSGTVLLVNSPHALTAVEAWQEAGRPMEVGWHPCLTLDRPVLPPHRVPTLVGRDGRFYRLGAFLARVALGRLSKLELEAELRAQYGRFCDLVGHPPKLVNSHHHVQVFPPVSKVLARILGEQEPLAYVRRVREPWHMLARIPGARLKRTVLSHFGRSDAVGLHTAGFPGNDWLAGITDPPYVADRNFFSRWLGQVPGRIVELTCHPGYQDESLLGRDCTPDDGQIERRVREFELLADTDFEGSCRRAGFAIVSFTDGMAWNERSRALVAA